PNEPELQADMRAATTDYFRTMRISLIEGRTFSDHDIDGSQKVALIDEKMARRFWPHETAVGKRVRPGSNKNPWWTVVGVVGVVKQYGLDTDTRMVVYFPQDQVAFGGLYIVARSAVDAARLAGPVTAQVHTLDPDIPVF